MRTAGRRLSRGATLLGWCTLAGALALALRPQLARAAEPIDFETYELRLSHPVRHELFVLPTSPAQRSLVAAGIQENGAGTLSIFTIGADGSLPREPTRTHRLPDDVLALDSDGEGLYLLRPGELLRWDPGDDSFRSVATVRSMYQVRPANELIPIRFLRDVDGDGDSDVVLPDFAGYRVWLRGAAGELVPGEQLGLSPIAHHQEYNDRITYRPVPVYFEDVDGDGTRDAVGLRGDTLVLFEGEGEGRFGAGKTTRLGLGVTERFLGDDVGDVDVDHTNRTWKRVVQVHDFDGDDAVDLFAHQVHSTGLFDKQHSLELHRGTRRGETLDFKANPVSRMESPVVIDDPTFDDIDGDGHLDVGVWAVDFGIRTLLGWLVTGTVDLDIAYYRLGPDGTFPPSPTRSEEVEAEFDLRSGKPTLPPAFLADVNGDKRQDLIVGSDGSELRIFPGNGSARLFEDTPTAVKVKLPGNGRELVDGLDVNGDGREDLVLRYGRIDGKDLDKSMKVMIAR